MSTARVTTPGKTRTCPHCRSEILESATVCPACRHHLRFEPVDRVVPGFSALSVDGTIRHPGGEAWEYTVVVSVRNEKGEEVTRKAVNVGALSGREQRSFSVSVDVTVPGASKPAPVPAKAESAPTKPTTAGQSTSAKPATAGQSTKAKPSTGGQPPPGSRKATT